MRAAVFALLGIALSVPSLAGENYALVLTGASSGDPYAAKYTAWRRSFVSTLRTKFAYPDDHVIVLAERASAGDVRDVPDVSDLSVRAATRDEVRRTLVDLRSRLTKDDQLIVLLVGHGTTAEGPRGADAKFNLAGPDLRASDWADLLKPLAARLIFVDTTAASFPFLRQLAGPGRIVITATDSTAQEFETVFGEFFVRAFDDPSADADKNGRVSVFEAFTYASGAVRAWFEQRGQLPTERALIDDSGDGAVARATFLQPPAAAAASGAASVARRQRELESLIDDLKRRRSSMPRAAYDAELERLLLELARVSAQSRRP